MSSPEVRATLTEFVDELESKIDTHRLEDVLSGDGSLTSADLGSKPESWTRKHLIRPLLDDVDLEWEPEIHGGGEGYPDFGLENLDVPVIGEDKPVNAIEEAEDDVKDYLNNRAASQGAEYGVATDGIEWVVYRIELGGDYLDYAPVATHDFRDVLLQIARDKNYLSQASVSEVDIDESAEAFFETFERDAFNTLLTREAPKRIRQQKQAGIEEFYDLYVELLFGEGSSSHDYETTLLDDVKAPPGANDTDKRRFTIRLVNRLLFVKFLEDRGVLPDRFLSERVEKYEQATSEVDDIGGGLYKSQLEPLFFGLFNAEDRISKHQGGWFDDIPYLNGSLFAPEEYERDYDVDDRMLITVVRDLVEGSELSDDSDDALDPSVLGNVFEMTINHISSGESQKEEGAYYTPSDVIRVITDDTVDPKAYEILVDVYGDRLSESTDLSEDDARSLVQSYELGEILRKIEQREGYFSDPDAIEDAYDQLGELKVIDPSCGSGHFLTGVLDELHRIRMSLLRGLHGDDLEDKDVYQAKKDLVLTSIYGVDVNPIAIEIAKLRVWLKMVEEGWEEQYGQLPNIDINIVPGNSLIGLPAISEGQAVLQSFDIDLSKLADLREAYRSGDITRRELDRRIDALRPELRQYYLDQINHYFEDRVTDPEEWESITAGLDQIFPSIQKITARQNNEEQLSDDQQARLEDAGFSVEPRFEKSAKIEGEDIDTVNDYSSLLDSGFIFELERQPTVHDVEGLTALKHREERLALAYEPFHYPVEFPEVATSNGGGYDVEFDIVVGNPPYGNVMEDIEKRFVEGYKTGNVNDIVAQFVERQLQILDDGGYLGNILALMFAYQTNAAPVREVLQDNLAETTIACFSRRPSQVFAGSQARTGIVTGRRQDGGDDQSIQTSRFIRFTDDNRQEIFRNITYESTAGLTLGEKIGSGEDYALPKIGESEIHSILEKLKDESDTVFRDKMSRSDENEHVVWRSYHPAYFCNPFLEDLYPAGEQSRDFKPMYFDNDLYRRSAFLLMQSSLFYMWWMVFENERDLNWKSIDAFPFPDEETLEGNREEIEELSEVLWAEMEDRFLGNIRETFDTIGAVKPITDKADDLFGPMYGLDEDEVGFVKEYDEEYRLSDVDQSQLVEFDS